MEPLKPEEKRAILKNRPNAQPEDIEEYERLLSVRFTEDPDFGRAKVKTEDNILTLSPQNSLEERLAQLHAKLFGHDSAKVPNQPLTK